MRGLPSHPGGSMNSATPRPENPLSLAADPHALSYAGVSSSTRVKTGSSGSAHASANPNT